jgi:hypothetical protein
MKRLIEFPLQDGDIIVIEIDEVEAAGGIARAARADGISERAKETFEDAVAKIKPASDSLIARLRELHDQPSEISLEFGVKLTATVGAVIASGGGEANYKVTLKWTKT